MKMVLLFIFLGATVGAQEPPMPLRTVLSGRSFTSSVPLAWSPGDNSEVIGFAIGAKSSQGSSLSWMGNATSGTVKLAFQMPVPTFTLNAYAVNSLSRTSAPSSSIAWPPAPASTRITTVIARCGPSPVGPWTNISTVFSGTNMPDARFFSFLILETNF